LKGSSRFRCEPELFVAGRQRAVANAMNVSLLGGPAVNSHSASRCGPRQVRCGAGRGFGPHHRSAAESGRRGEAAADRGYPRARARTVDGRDRRGPGSVQDRGHRAPDQRRGPQAGNLPRGRRRPEFAQNRPGRQDPALAARPRVRRDRRAPRRVPRYRPLRRHRHRTRNLRPRSHRPHLHRHRHRP
jgi:hypothetical protein